MRKFILCLIVLCWSAGTSAAVLNDADAFVIARSAKLGEMEDSFSSGKQVTKKNRLRSGGIRSRRSDLVQNGFRVQR